MDWQRTGRTAEKEERELESGESCLQRLFLLISTSERLIWILIVQDKLI